MDAPNEQTDGLRLEEALRAMELRGFRCQALPAAGGQVRCCGCGASSPAERVAVLSQARIEGVSDPADETFVAGVRCPGCGTLESLVLAYGPRARRDEAAVLARLPPPLAPDVA